MLTYILDTFATLIPYTGPRVLQKGPRGGVIYLQISEILVLYQILDIYPHVSFINKGKLIFHKLHVLCDSLQVVFLVLTEINKVSGCMYSL